MAICTQFKFEIRFFLQTNFVDTQTKPSFATPGNRFSDNDFSDDEIVLPKKLKKRKKVNISGTLMHLEELRGQRIAVNILSFCLDDEDNDDNDDDEEDSNTIHSDESNADDNDHGNKSDADLSDVETVEKIVEYDSEENEIEVSSQWLDCRLTGNSVLIERKFLLKGSSCAEAKNRRLFRK